MAFLIHQWPATVARVDGCIYLYVFYPIPDAVHLRDYSLCGCVIQTKWMSYSYHHISVLSLFIVAQLYFWYLHLQWWLQKSQVMLTICVPYARQPFFK